MGMKRATLIILKTFVVNVIKLRNDGFEGNTKNGVTKII